jgi:hypothetical protein
MRVPTLVRVRAWGGVAERDQVLPMAHDEDRTLVFGRKPEEPRNPDFLRGRSLRLVTTPAPPYRKVSGRQVAVYRSRGELHAASLGTCRVWLQPWGSEVRLEPLSDWPGEVLRVPTTLWFPPTKPDMGAASPVWQLAICNPAPPPRWEQKTKPKRMTESDDAYPPSLPTETQLEAMILRGGQLLRFPAETMSPNRIGGANTGVEKRLDKALERLTGGVQKGMSAAVVSDRLDAIAQLIQSHAITPASVHEAANELGVDLGLDWLFRGTT